MILINLKGMIFYTLCMYYKHIWAIFGNLQGKLAGFRIIDSYTS